MMKCQVAALVFVCVATLAGCGRRKHYECTATASYLGNVRKGRATDFDDEAKAKVAAVAQLCAGYCENDDPDVDGAILKAKGQVPAVERAERASVLRTPQVTTIYETCKAQCDAALAKLPVEQACAYWMRKPVGF